MELVGGMLIVAAQNWVPSDEGTPSILCGGSRGSSPDALLFYDVRDPQNPKYWGKIDGNDLDLLRADNNNRKVIDALGMFRMVGTDSKVPPQPALPFEEWFMTAGGGKKDCNLLGKDCTLLFRTLKAKPENLDPFDPATWLPSNLWEWVNTVENPHEAFRVAANQNGMNFNSYMLESALVIGSSLTNGIERNFFFDGSEASGTFDSIDFKFKFKENLYFDHSGAGAYGGSVREINSVTMDVFLLPEYDGKDWDADSIYVTRNGVPIVYAVTSDGTILQVYDTRNFNPLNTQIFPPTLRTPPAGSINKSVTNTEDRGPGSLRQAIGYGGNIVLPQGETIIALRNGPLVVDKHDVIIDACGTGGLTISGSNMSRVFEVGEGINLTLKCVTITDGFARQGAGVLNMGGNVVLEKVIVTNNTAWWPHGAGENAGDGGGILNGINQLHWFEIDQAQCVAAQGSTAPCQSEDSGADIPVKGQNYGGTMIILDSEISGNTAHRNDGGIANMGGTLRVERSTIASNSAYRKGGAIYNSDGLMADDSERAGSVELENSTITRNTALIHGGGIANEDGGELLLSHTTVVGNEATAGSGSGIYNVYATLTLENSIVSNNLNGYGLSGNVSGLWTGNGANLIDGDPVLAPLGYNGGPTLTMLPLFDSPVIDAAVNSTVAKDQRGNDRPGGVLNDLGAVERVDTDPLDTDGDGVDDRDDNCPTVSNPDQLDTYGDPRGDLCESVTNLTDGSPGSLRDIIAHAAPGQVIMFHPDISGGVIILTGGELVINKELTIDASNLPGGVTISGDANNNGVPDAGDVRVFSIGGNVILKGITVTGGYASFGGCISNGGYLELIDSTVSGCTAINPTDGGGIYNIGVRLILTNSTVSDNQAGFLGGGIANSSLATLTLINSTVSGNQADFGGGIFSTNQATIVHSTVSNNSADFGGGMYYSGAGVDLMMENSIIAGNFAASGPDILLDSGNIIIEGTNLIGDNDTVGAYFTADDLLVGTPANPLRPLLNPLGNYGGPTLTMPPFADSPAVDAALLITATSPTTDQRGVSRPIGTANDIGAVERFILDPVDTDRDGLSDALDNCRTVSNANQRDSNNDGYGNICDPDFDNNGIVNASDLAYFKSKFFTTDPDADLNGNGIVNAADLAILKSMFFKPPGPSGLAP